MSEDEKQSKPDKKRHRSPSYPVISIKDAIEKVSQIYRRDKRAYTTYEAVLEHLGYSAKARSGQSGRVVAALRQYGLLDEKNGQFRVSDSAFKILELPEDAPERKQLVKESALKPPLFKKILQFYDGEIPSDTTLRSNLIFNEGFNPDSVAMFIRSFRETLEVANPSPTDYNDDIESTDYEESSVTDKPMQHQTSPTASTTNTPPPITGGTRVIIDIPPDGEVKISFSGDVNMKTFQFVNGILKLQSEVFPEKPATVEETSENN